MDVRYAASLGDAYDQLFKAILLADSNIGWPICADPQVRRQEFLSFFKPLADKGDEWAQYYIRICTVLEDLLDIDRPKDTTRL